MCIFKEYRYVFGKEGEGVHSYRLFDIAIIDVIFTIIGAGLISYIFNLNVLDFILITITLFIAGIILHYLFCVETTINKAIYSFINSYKKST
jgi:hypothetical protein